MKIKFSDLINLNGNGTFAKRLYAQFQTESNLVKLVYVPQMDAPIPNNSILLWANRFYATGNKSVQDSDRSQLYDNYYFSAKINPSDGKNDL